MFQMFKLVVYNQLLPAVSHVEMFFILPIPNENYI